MDCGGIVLVRVRALAGRLIAGWGGNVNGSSDGSDRRFSPLFFSSSTSGSGSGASFRLSMDR